MDWFHRLYEGRESFGNKQEERAYRDKQAALTRSEVNDLIGLIGFPPCSRILDAYCGNGRHAIALAKKGFDVTGVDISFSRIAFASRWARHEGARASFVVSDIRALCLRCSFNGVLILGGSFTHCLNEAENIELLRGLTAVLRPGGLILIDNPNPVRFWRIRYPTGSTAEQRRLPYFDLPLGAGEVSGHVRYYGVDMMKKLLQRANIAVKNILGDRGGAPYSLDGPRLIVIGQTRKDIRSNSGACCCQ